MKNLNKYPNEDDEGQFLIPDTDEEESTTDDSTQPHLVSAITELLNEFEKEDEEDNKEEDEEDEDDDDEDDDAEEDNEKDNEEDNILNNSDPSPTLENEPNLLSNPLKLQPTYEGANKGDQFWTIKHELRRRDT